MVLSVDAAMNGSWLFPGSSVMVWPDGSMTARCGYDEAVRRLYEYESSGVLPEDARNGHVRADWERYTVKTPDGVIRPRRGWERVLGRLKSYESFGLTPRQWREKYALIQASTERNCSK